MRIGEINEECDIFTTILDDSDLQTSVCLQHFQENLRILPTNRKQNQSKVIKTLQSLGYHHSPSLLLFEMSRAKRSITSQRKGGKETMSSLDHLQIIKSYVIDTSLCHKTKHSPKRNMFEWEPRRLGRVNLVEAFGKLPKRNKVKISFLTNVLSHK